MALFRFGDSFFQNQTVADILAEKVANTCAMIVPALLVSVVFGTILGALAGWKRGSRFEQATVTTSLLLHSAPSFFVGILVLMVFSYQLRWLPPGGMVSLGGPEGFWAMIASRDYLQHLILPGLVLRAKGLTERRILVHATRNALLPLVTYIAVMTGLLLQGQVLLEIIFAWPGIGRELVTALGDLDYPVAQAALYVMALVILLLNLLADLLYGLIDPRSR
jgi:peptide/nickel transport system permease protein